MSSEHTQESPAEFLACDHDRLTDLFTRAVKNMPNVDLALYEEFRKGLFRHIAIEEKIVFPFLKQHPSSPGQEVFDRLRRDHGAIVALLVPLPSASVVATLESVLGIHNGIEEGTDGVYALLNSASSEESQQLMEDFHAAPEVPTHPLKPTDQVIEVTKRAVDRAGYVFIDQPDMAS